MIDGNNTVHRRTVLPVAVEGQGVFGRRGKVGPEVGVPEQEQAETHEPLQRFGGRVVWLAQACPLPGVDQVAVAKLDRAHPAAIHRE